MANLLNIDFLVAGCNTRCSHCYVNAGPGPLMPAEDAFLCIQKLDRLAGYFEGEASFTLDNEPMNHPQIAEIIAAASATEHIKNHHHGMTTGIALMHRKDREKVIQAYISRGYDVFGITLHGGDALHDKVTGRSGAHAAAMDAAAFFRQHGAKVEVSLMLNRFFIEEENAVSAALGKIVPDYVAMYLPIFTPHSNMHEFEPYRASLGTLSALEGCLAEWGQDAAKLMHAAEQSTPASAISRLKKGPGLKELFAAEQQELYMSLHQDCMLYVGNTGAETCCLGNLKELDMRELASKLNLLAGNRDYGAFFAESSLPKEQELLRQLGELPQDAIYGDFESVLYRGLWGMGIPTKTIG